MSDNRKYYYLKLKESYFDDDAIVLLESMQDGMLYSNILLKLYLKSLKYGGTLQLDENIPYTAQMIATITRQQVGTVERALQIFMKLGLVEPLDNGALYMSNIELFIGQSSTEGERKRRARMKISEQKRLSGQVSEAKADICPPEIEIKKEIDIEIEKERESEPGRAAPAAYGRYKNVILTDTELSELQAELPDKWEYYIDRLSGYIASTGRKYKNHAATIRRWVADDTATSENVYMMSLVDEQDLAEFLDENEETEKKEESAVVLPEITATPEPETTVQPETEVKPESSGNKMFGSAILGGGIVLVFGGLAAFALSKFRKKKEDGIVEEGLEFADDSYINEDEENVEDQQK